MATAFFVKAVVTHWQNLPHSPALIVNYLLPPLALLLIAKALVRGDSELRYLLLGGPEKPKILDGITGSLGRVARMGG